MSDLIPVFDGHNDALLRLWNGGRRGLADRFTMAGEGHIDLVRAKAGGLVGGFFAMFPPPGGTFKMPRFQPPYDIPLTPMMDQKDALAIIMEQAGVAAHLDRAGLMRLCRTRGELDQAIGDGVMAAILHMEGAEAIDADLLVLEALYAAGLRSLGPVWSRPTIFAHGVPFRYPSDADIGPGLTDAGKRLIAACSEMQIIVDTSHLNMAGFDDIASAGLPLVATHSNAHAVSPGARNLTDRQLKAIGETGGMAGLNYGTMFLRPDGRAHPEGALEHAITHLSHMIEQAGEDHVGLGSDFDGAPMPDKLQSAADLPNLVQAMRDHQFGDALIRKICGENWLNFVGRALG